MSPEQIAKFESIIDSKIQSVSERISTSEKLSLVAEQFPDVIDKAAHMSSDEVNKATMNSLKEQLIGLRKAKVRIREHEFGYCEVCGDDIALERLETVPYAVQCHECAGLAFLRKKQTSGLAYA